MKQARLFSLMFVLVLSLLATACQPAGLEATTVAPPAPTVAPPVPTEAGISLTDGLGRTVSLAGPAQRVVSLAPSNTEILFAIGAGSQVVGRDEFSDYPAEAQQIANIGGGYGEIDVETLVSLQPDLVLAADIITPEQIQSLESLDLTVYALPNPADFPALYENIHTVARLTGKDAQANALVESLTQRVQAVENKTKALAARPEVFYVLDTTDPSAPWTSGPGTFVDLLIDKAGGQNLGAVLDSAWAQISIEDLVTADPDLILLGNFTWGGVQPDEVAAWPGWDTLTAVQAGQVLTFDDNLVSRPGPRLVDGLEGMATLLHPDLFE